MRVIVQRVKYASISVDNKIISKINNGFLLLIGFKEGDTLEEVNYLARKISKLRIFDDSEGKLNLAINEVKGEILSISQFTLYGDVINSNRPSFTQAMNYHEAKALYIKFNNILQENYNISLKTGLFGEHMEIELLNDGPVTMILEK